ncbi:glycerol-3-phosphate 1-O-acyltransferase PlsY [Uliginosibacterium sediminicola]|uniref:Glycerol-3-phosphate acyltransferase n=1 Tax=Uliginosibacterium sediminicola TaxID=2024550 RepID=A0ABU9YWG3_9RHOO
MPAILAPALAFIAAFLLGSIPFAVIVSRLMRLEDPRKYGSGNPGATNVLRSGNKTAAVLTLLGDSVKGLFAVALAKALAPQLGLSASTLALVALGVFLGHVFSVFLRFKGGKGVATAAGVLLGIDGRLGLATLAVWLLVAFVTRYSSLAAICAAVAAPAIAYALGAGNTWAGACTIMSAILIWRHAGNIRKLLAGQESRIGKKA